MMLEDRSLFHGIDPPLCSVTVLGSESVEESAFMVELKHTAFSFSLRPYRETQQRKRLTRDPFFRLWVRVENFIFQEEPQAPPASFAVSTPLQGPAHHSLRPRHLVESQLSFAAPPQAGWMNVLKYSRKRTAGALYYCGNIILAQFSVTMITHFGTSVLHVFEGKFVPATISANNLATGMAVMPSVREAEM